jgi:hypothetical protein
MGTSSFRTQGHVLGLRKKIAKISEELVIGWTEHVMAAEVVLGEITRRGPTSKDKFEQVLTRTNWASLGHQRITLTGWIAKPDPQAFRWDNGYVPYVYWGEPNYIGSGRDVAHDLVDRYAEFLTRDAGPFDYVNDVVYALFGAKFDEVGHLVGLGHQEWMYHYYVREPVSILVQIRPHTRGPHRARSASL